MSAKEQAITETMIRLGLEYITEDGIYNRELISTLIDRAERGEFKEKLEIIGAGAMGLVRNLDFGTAVQKGEL